MSRTLHDTSCLALSRNLHKDLDPSFILFYFVTLQWAEMDTKLECGNSNCGLLFDKFFNVFFLMFLRHASAFIFKVLVPMQKILNFFYQEM